MYKQKIISKINIIILRNKRYKIGTKLFNGSTDYWLSNILFHNGDYWLQYVLI